MARNALGISWLAVCAAVLAACESSDSDDDAASGGAIGSGGRGGATATGGASGAITAGGASGALATGGSQASSGGSSVTTGGSASSGASSGGSSGTSDGDAGEGNAGESNAGGSSAGGGAGSEGGSGAVDPGGERGVTNPEVAFDGTELDLEANYYPYHQSEGGVDIVDDPAGGERQVLRFRRPKEEEWTHEMVRLLDKRSDYQDAAQVTEWETAYHYRQQMYVPNDPQYSRDFVNLLEDFHCEPCEANNLQLYTSYLEEDSVCLWVSYSTDEGFDPRGDDRGGTIDPWDLLGENRIEATIAADGTPNLPAEMPETASLVLCREDLQLSDLFERWVDVEFLVKVSSFESGVIKVWIDGKPFFYDGPNNYRWNQTGPDSDGALPVNVFQWGLYMAGYEVMEGTPSEWVLYATPPILEIGDDIFAP